MQLINQYVNQLQEWPGERRKSFSCMLLNVGRMQHRSKTSVQQHSRDQLWKTSEMWLRAPLPDHNTILKHSHLLSVVKKKIFTTLSCSSAFSFPISPPQFHCEFWILAFRIVLVTPLCYIICAYEGGLNKYVLHSWYMFCFVVMGCLFCFFSPVVLIRIFAIPLAIFIFLLCFIYFYMSEVIH